MSDYYYVGGGVKKGPVDLPTLRDLVRAGIVAPSDLVWTATMEQWTPASDVPELKTTPALPQAASAKVPPPLPPVATARVPPVPPPTVAKVPTASPPSKLTPVGTRAAEIRSSSTVELRPSPKANTSLVAKGLNVVGKVLTGLGVLLISFLAFLSFAMLFVNKDDVIWKGLIFAVFLVLTVVFIRKALQVELPSIASKFLKGMGVLCTILIVFVIVDSFRDAAQQKENAKKMAELQLMNEQRAERAWQEERREEQRQQALEAQQAEKQRLERQRAIDTFNRNIVGKWREAKFERFSATKEHIEFLSNGIIISTGDDGSTWKGPYSVNSAFNVLTITPEDRAQMVFDIVSLDFNRLIINVQGSKDLITYNRFYGN